jgi:hypothetical protein
LVADFKKVRNGEFPTDKMGVCIMAIGQLKVLALSTYGIAEGAAVPTSPDRGK